MGSPYAELGATLREQGATVEDWLRGVSVGRASRLIKRLKWECKLIRSARRKGAIPGGKVGAKIPGGRELERICRG